MKRYRKKPVLVEAIQYLPGMSLKDFPKGVNMRILEAAPNAPMSAPRQVEFYVRTLEGQMIVSPYDWIIRGTHGELYPCKPEIFETIYEEVEES